MSLDRIDPNKQPLRATIEHSKDRGAGGVDMARGAYALQGADNDLFLDRLLALEAICSRPMPSPHFGSAMAHPLAGKALDIAEKAFSTLGDTIGLMDERKDRDAPRPPRLPRETNFRTILPRKFAAAAQSMADLGLTRPQAEAVLTKAYRRAAIEAVENFGGADLPLAILGRACMRDPFVKKHPGLESNAMLLETTVGDLGSWLRQFRMSFELGTSPFCLLVDTSDKASAPSRLDYEVVDQFKLLSDRWDHASETRLDAHSAARANALLDCVKASSVARPNSSYWKDGAQEAWLRPAGQAMRAAIDQALIAEVSATPDIAEKSRRRRAVEFEPSAQPRDPSL